VETRPIGSLAVSIVGVGCNNFGGRIDGWSLTPTDLEEIDSLLRAVV